MGGILHAGEYDRTHSCRRRDWWR